MTTTFTLIKPEDIIVEVDRNFAGPSKPLTSNTMRSDPIFWRVNEQIFTAK